MLSDLYLLRGPLHCSFFMGRQCEGLDAWNERMVQFPRFFCVLNLTKGTGVLVFVDVYDN